LIGIINSVLSVGLFASVFSCSHVLRLPFFIKMNAQKARDNPGIVCLVRVEDDPSVSDELRERVLVLLAEIKSKNGRKVT
jgi:hypothetical protein